VELLKHITGFAHAPITMSAFILAVTLNPVRTDWLLHVVDALLLKHTTFYRNSVFMCFIFQNK
jgi:hypothetical protein